jgi:CxxC-x17-CxxC domain-containing protein
MDFQDQAITCADCHSEFTFTAGEQQFYDQKGFSSPPKRCKTCRELRRRDRGPGGPGGGGGSPRGRGTEPSEYRSPSFRDSDPTRGRAPVSEPGRPRGRRRGPPPAVASVEEYRAPSFSPRPAPFPAGADGVIDEELDSIGNQLNPQARTSPSGGPRSTGERREGGSRGRSRAMHDIVCAECGKESRVPFKPQSGKPVYCRECYQLKKDGPKEEAVG